MIKHRIIILMHYLELGGAEMALMGLLSALDPKRVDADLFIYSHQGALMKFVPKWVNLLPEIGSYSAIERPIGEVIRRGHLGVVIGRTIAKYKCRKYRKSHPAVGDDGAIMQYVGDYVTPWLPKINPSVEYDLCISFLTPHNIGLYKVRAKKRLAWIHTDYSTVDIDVARELPVWGAYDKIASISDEVTKSFLTKFPQLAPKIIQIENILSADFVRSRATEFDAAAEFVPYLEGGGNSLIHR